MTDLRKILSVNMKLHRKKLGLSQAKLAEMVDVSDNYIALLETGRRLPSISMLETLAKAMEIDVLELLSAKQVKLVSKSELKNNILADIDNILTLRLLNSE